MRLTFPVLSLVGILLSCSVGQAAEPQLSSMRCFASPAAPVTAYAPAKEAAMSADAYHAPKTSPRLETLDVLSVGMSLDVFRQGQVWKALQEQNAMQAEALHVGSILPMDPRKYPVTADDKDIASEKREADALELGLKNFLEKWPIPTVTVVRGWNPNTPNLRFTPEETQGSLSAMVNDMRIPAGLHWHRIVNLQDGIICNDTPEGVLEALFRLFERNPDLPAVLIYANEGFNMALSLMAKGEKPIGVGTGPRQPGELTDTMVALIVGRPERVDWLRQFAPLHQGQRKPDRPRVPWLGLAQAAGGVPPHAVHSPALDRAGSGAVGCVAGAGQAASAGECAADPPGYRRTAQARSSHRTTGRCLEDGQCRAQAGARPAVLRRRFERHAAGRTHPGAGRRAEFAGLAGLAGKLRPDPAPGRHRRGLALRWHRPGDHGQLPQRRQQHGDAVAAQGPGDPDRHQLADAWEEARSRPVRRRPAAADRQRRRSAAIGRPGGARQSAHDPVAARRRLCPGRVPEQPQTQHRLAGRFVGRWCPAPDGVFVR